MPSTRKAGSRIRLTAALGLALAAATLAATLAVAEYASGPTPSQSAARGIRRQGPRKIRRAGLRFSTQQALDHVRFLAGEIGARVAGSAKDRRAAAYLSDRLTAYGYSPSSQPVSLPDGGRTQNIMATKTGVTADVIVVGAHYDSVSGTPGANDNAASVAIVLELARVLTFTAVRPSVEFVFFGGEEELDDYPDDNLYGSAEYVRSLSPDQKSRIAGVITLDMVARGSDFWARSMPGRSKAMSNALISYARSRGVKLAYYRSPTSGGWSDYESFELAGIPTAWLEREDDPDYHTKADNFRHVSASRVSTTGRLLEGYLRSLTETEVLELKSSR